MQFELLTVGGVKYTGRVAEISLATTSGRVGILPHHEPLTTVVAPGPVVVRPAGNEPEQLFALYGGLLEVTPEGVRLLADEAELADDLIQTEIEAALKRAEELKAQARDRHELHRAQELIDRQTVRLEVAQLRRRGRHHNG